MVTSQPQSLSLQQHRQTPPSGTAEHILGDILWSVRGSPAVAHLLPQHCTLLAVGGAPSGIVSYIDRHRLGPSRVPCGLLAPPWERAPCGLCQQPLYATCALPPCVPSFPGLPGHLQAFGLFQKSVVKHGKVWAHRHLFPFLSQ